VVAGLGSTAWDITAAGDSPLSFPLWGAMGQAAMLGLGLALAQPERRVLVVTGDGEMLMGLGGLATIGVQQPANLTVVVIDNERYGETVMQRTHTAWGLDLAAIAAGSRFKHAITATADVAPVRELDYRATGPDISASFFTPSTGMCWSLSPKWPISGTLGATSVLSRMPPP